MSRIPEEEYVESHGMKVVTVELFNKHHTIEDLVVFSEWYTGQTGLMMEDGTMGIYICDYERWLREGKLARQLPETFD